MSIHCLTRFRWSNISERSTTRSRTFGNFDIGSRVIGLCGSRLSMSAEQDWRARPLMIIVQMPQTCSRQFMFQTGGVVFRPSRVTGFFLISIRKEVMLRVGREGGG